MLTIRKLFLKCLFLSVLITGAGCYHQQTLTVPENFSSQNQNFELKISELSKKYTKDIYGFTFSYPENTTVVEQGPNGNQIAYNNSSVLYGFPIPLLNSFSVRIGGGAEGGDEVLNLQVPNSIQFSVLTNKGWNPDACGEKLLNPVSDPIAIMIDGKNASKVISFDSVSTTKKIYYCINATLPVIAVVTPRYQELGEKIVESLQFTSSTTTRSNLVPISATNPPFLVRYNAIFSSAPAQYQDDVLLPSLLLSLNNECLFEKTYYATSTVTNGYYIPDVYHHEFKPRCPVLGTFFLPPVSGLKAEVRTISDPTIGELYDGTTILHFIKNDQSAVIPDLHISTDTKINPEGSEVFLTYLNDKAIYVEYSGINDNHTYYYFDGTKWRWINLYEKVKPLITAPYPVSFSMSASEKYLYVWESGPFEMNDFMRTEVFEKRQRSQQQVFILDRSTYKVLWNGTFWTQS